MSPQHLRILVIGAGVIGSVYAARLQAAGYTVTLLARGQHAADLRATGLLLEDASTGQPATSHLRISGTGAGRRRQRAAGTEPRDGSTDGQRHPGRVCRFAVPGRSRDAVQPAAHLPVDAALVRHSLLAARLADGGGNAGDRSPCQGRAGGNGPGCRGDPGFPGAGAGSGSDAQALAGSAHGGRVSPAGSSGMNGRAREEKAEG